MATLLPCDRTPSANEKGRTLYDDRLVTVNKTNSSPRLRCVVSSSH
jgi:hypothetical protein